jgi:hypothetical protein
MIKMNNETTIDEKTVETPSRKRMIGIGLTKLAAAAAIGMYVNETHPVISEVDILYKPISDISIELLKTTAFASVEVLLGYKGLHYIIDGTKSLYNSLKPR